MSTRRELLNSPSYLNSPQTPHPTFLPYQPVIQDSTHANLSRYQPPGMALLPLNFEPSNIDAGFTFEREMEEWRTNGYDNMNASLTSMNEAMQYPVYSPGRGQAEERYRVDGEDDDERGAAELRRDHPRWLLLHRRQRSVRGLQGASYQARLKTALESESAGSAIFYEKKKSPAR